VTAVPLSIVTLAKIQVPKQGNSAADHASKTFPGLAPRTHAASAFSSSRYNPQNITPFHCADSGLAGVGLATTPPQAHDCVTIADTDVKELGDKCDKGELAVMKSGKSTVEKESDGYDVTLPLHVGGKTIGIIAMDFKLDEQEAGLLDRANIIAKEMEAQIPETSKLFEPAR
jgi:hypothetical protein